MKIATRTGVIATATVLTLALAACTPSNEQPADSTSSAGQSQTDASAPPELSGNLVGAGASSQESAMAAWKAGFNATYPNVTVSYDPIGSGGGRTQFLEGATSFAGTDALMNPDEYALAVTACDGDLGAIHLPVYISPIAVIFNLPGVSSLNMSADLIAQIFNGTITNWDDPAIAAHNEGVTLPDLTITTVHRSTDSGSSENFTDYLAKASTSWDYEPSGEWPEGLPGESGPGTSDLVSIVQETEGSIGYVDASRAGKLGTVALKVGDAYVPFSAEAAAAVVDASPMAQGTNGENDLAIALDRTTTAKGAYPLVLVSYNIICQQYDDEAERELVTAFVGYQTSPEGQAAAASATGSSPLSPQMSAKIADIISQVENN